MADQIIWNHQLLKSHLVELNNNIKLLEDYLEDIDQIEFTNSNGQSAQAVSNYKNVIKKNIASRIAYMQAMVKVIVSKSDEMNTVDMESFNMPS